MSSPEGDLSGGTTPDDFLNVNTLLEGRSIGGLSRSTGGSYAQTPGEGTGYEQLLQRPTEREC
jgi:hypothetical protein